MRLRDKRRNNLRNLNDNNSFKGSLPDLILIQTSIIVTKTEEYKNCTRVKGYEEWYT
jgi:hypothetical protein